MDSKHSIHNLLLNQNVQLGPLPLFDNPYSLAPSTNSLPDHTPAGPLPPAAAGQDITVKAPAAKGKGAKKREQEGDSEGEADDGTPGGAERKKVRKRNRLALSCTECKRR